MRLNGLGGYAGAAPRSHFRTTRCRDELGLHLAQNDLESRAETVRLAVFLAHAHLWTCIHCQMPGARCSGGPRMGYLITTLAQ